MMLGAKFGWNSLIDLENMMFSKEVNVFLLFCYLPLRMFEQTWIFFIHVYMLALELKLSLFSNLLLSSLILQNGVVSR